MKMQIWSERSLLESKRRQVWIDEVELKYSELIQWQQWTIVKIQAKSSRKGACELCLSLCEYKTQGEKMSRIYLFYRPFVKGWQLKPGILISFYEASYILINVKLIYTLRGYIQMAQSNKIKEDTCAQVCMCLYVFIDTSFNYIWLCLCCECQVPPTAQSSWLQSGRQN